MHSWSTFGAKTNHRQTRTHKTHHDPNLGEATTFPLIIYFVHLHEAHIQMTFPKLGFPWLWGPIILPIRVYQNYSPFWELSNDMSHATYTKGNRGDSLFLMVKNQIANLIPDLSIGHNLCFRCVNGSYEPILDIYISIVFQWYKELFNPLGFDPYNCSLKIWESTNSKLPKWKLSWECEGSFPHTFLHSQASSWLATLQAFTLVTSPRLGMRQK